MGGGSLGEGLSGSAGAGRPRGPAPGDPPAPGLVGRRAARRRCAARTGPLPARAAPEGREEWRVGGARVVVLSRSSPADVPQLICRLILGLPRGPASVQRYMLMPPLAAALAQPPNTFLTHRDLCSMVRWALHDDRAKAPLLQLVGRQPPASASLCETMHLLRQARRPPASLPLLRSHAPARRPAGAALPHARRPPLRHPPRYRRRASRHARLTRAAPQAPPRVRDAARRSHAVGGRTTSRSSSRRSRRKTRRASPRCWPAWRRAGRRTGWRSSTPRCRRRSPRWRCTPPAAPFCARSSIARPSPTRRPSRRLRPRWRWSQSRPPPRPETEGCASRTSSGSRLQRRKAPGERAGRGGNILSRSASPRRTAPTRPPREPRWRRCLPLGQREGLWMARRRLQAPAQAGRCTLATPPASARVVGYWVRREGLGAVPRKTQGEAGIRLIPC